MYKKNKKAKNVVLTALCLAAMGAPGIVLACDAAGENTHIGQVLSVDGQTFTIRDAQSGGPISFTAGQQLKQMPAAGDTVAVEYSATHKVLTAESVR